MEIIDAVLENRLDRIQIKWREESSVCVVLASGGYPGSYEKGKAITGLDNLPEGGVVFHAGTAEMDGATVTAGGRVLGVTATGRDISAALETAYRAVKNICFDGMHYRRDVGKRALDRCR